MTSIDFARQVRELEEAWGEEARWSGIRREYPAEDVVMLRGSVRVEQTIAKLAATRLWKLLHSEELVRTFGALTGTQAVQMVRAGLQAIYLSGWQVAADGSAGSVTNLRPLLRYFSLYSQLLVDIPALRPRSPPVPDRSRFLIVFFTEL